MHSNLLQDTLIRQEQRAVKLFVVLFYVIYFLYDIAFYFLLPAFERAKAEIGYPMPAVSLAVHAILLGLIPAAVYSYKRAPQAIKYIYFITYISATVVSNLIIYSNGTYAFRDGNLVELFFVLFSPIFVNRRFCRVVTLGMLARYAVPGLLLREPLVVIPILLVLVLSAIAYVILYRFLSYLQAYRDAYNTQLDSIVKGMITALELRDPYTRGHSERVAKYSIMLAKQTGIFNDEQLKSFYYSCLLHDVGKVHMPDAILLKSSGLTPEEYEIIKTHPAVGADAVKDIQGLAYAVDVIRHHHERWDGKGYPDGLQGVRIPLLARIAAVADAFDAMTSARSYRPAMAPDDACRQIVNGSGSQFDPGIVEHFRTIYPEIKKVFAAQVGDGAAQASRKTASGKEVTHNENSQTEQS
jgi:hypothetical protein